MAKNTFNCEVGEIRKISKIVLESRHLLELGFTPGISIQIVAKAPFNGPISVRLRDTVFALRQSELQGIL